MRTGKGITHEEALCKFAWHFNNRNRIQSLVSCTFVANMVDNASISLRKGMNDMMMVVPALEFEQSGVDLSSPTTIFTRKRQRKSDKETD